MSQPTLTLPRPDGRSSGVKLRHVVLGATVVLMVLKLMTQHHVGGLGTLPEPSDTYVSDAEPAELDMTGLEESGE